MAFGCRISFSSNRTEATYLDASSQLHDDDDNNSSNYYQYYYYGSAEKTQQLAADQSPVSSINYYSGSPHISSSSISTCYDYPTYNNADGGGHGSRFKRMLKRIMPTPMRDEQLGRLLDQF